MKSWRDSLYTRLVLALLIALGASFATMYFLFLNHMEGFGENNAVRFISTQVRLTEALLETRSAAEIPVLDGLKVADLPVITAVDEHRRERAERIRRHIAEELGRAVQIQPSSSPGAGLWVDVLPGNKARQWLFIPDPKPHHHKEDSLTLSMIVGFLVFFSGGLLLLWQIQRPLKRLSRALETAGHSRTFERLQVDGGGITRTLSLHYNDMAERLEQMEFDRTVMLAGIAHDLRTPITRLRLLTELAQTNRRDDFVQNLDHVENIVDQFLTYSRGSAGEALARCELGSFIEEVAAAYPQVEIKLPAEECLMEIRQGGLRRALINLIENALEYGSSPVTVTLVASLEETLITVADCGPGILPQDLATAIRPFSRLDASRGGEGHCGLGLVIAKNIVEEQGGTFELANQPQGGLIVSIRLSSQK